MTQDASEADLETRLEMRLEPSLQTRVQTLLQKMLHDACLVTIVVLGCRMIIQFSRQSSLHVMIFWMVIHVVLYALS